MHCPNTFKNIKNCPIFDVSEDDCITNVRSMLAHCSTASSNNIFASCSVHPMLCTRNIQPQHWRRTNNSNKSLHKVCNQLTMTDHHQKGKQIKNKLIFLVASICQKIMSSETMEIFNLLHGFCKHLSSFLSITEALSRFRKLLGSSRVA